MTLRTLGREQLAEMTVELGERIRAAVHPLLGEFSSREVVGTAVGGDATMEVDRVAEAVVSEFVAEEEGLAVFSEDLGFVTKSDPMAVFVVDPVDGTRPAAAGLESCCVSIASTRVTDAPTIGDVEVGLVRELKCDRSFLAIRDEGLTIEGPGGELIEPHLTSHYQPEVLFWAGGFRGRPYLPVATVLAELADRCSLGGSVFDLGSASFIMTRILTGQLDAYVDPGLRLLEEFPELEPEFLAVGGGSILCNSPYDVAASILCFDEVGAPVTDCWGRDLSDRPLLGSDRSYQISILAASNTRLHEDLMDMIEAGIDRFAATRPELLRA